ncbi:MAG: DUF3795 domain-containing protein [Bacteroidota bacterium]|nr:DUF3795 domain-containing protein [Bacteroidota bacterium]
MNRVSICGDICTECPRFIATKNNDTEELQKVARLWYRLGFRDRIVSIEEIKCTGCNKQKSCSYGLNDCVHLKDKDNCGECDLFPCDKIENAFKKSELAESDCKGKCSEEEYLQLKRAFFNKKEILSNIKQWKH